jgi:hypothetical protein
MAATFEDAYLPRHDRRATTGSKSMTFTVPKEVSLFAEGYREEGASRAINPAVGSRHSTAFGDKDEVAVAVIHTRKECVGIHCHAHVLVGKFAVDRASGKVRSLNSKASGNWGHRLGPPAALGVEGRLEGGDRSRIQGEPRHPHRAARAAPPVLIMPDGTRLDALNRIGRRQLEKDIAPWYGAPDKGAARRQLRLGVMDDRSHRVRRRGGVGSRRISPALSRPGASLPGTREAGRTSRAIGYLTAEGRPTPKFRLHSAV